MILPVFTGVPNMTLLQGIKMWNNSNKQKKWFAFMTNLQTYYHFKLDFQRVDQVVNPRHQTPQGQSVTKSGTPLLNILVENVSMT